MIMRSKNNYTPDVLDCLANLSNDEVFTPPVVVNQMLDMLPQEVFESKDTTFLDPFTKSGVFLREITKRLLEHQIPDYKLIADQIEYITKEAIQQAVLDGHLDRDNMDENEARKIGDAAIKAHPDANKFRNFEIDLQDALDHILQKQVFGIAITELTAQLARRSLYCSKDASGRYSIVGTVFGVNSDGNIRFEPMKHTWNPSNQDGTARQGASCIYCGASAANLDRPNDLESHAYEFIHKDIDEIRKELGNMEFTVVCGNPPYQLETAGDDNGAQAKPIYHKFVEQAMRLNPKYLLMITPSRWFSGGWGLDDFRNTMMTCRKITEIHDYQNSKECFPGVEIKGGVSYFLWNRDANSDCKFVQHDGKVVSESIRPLQEEGCDIVIRYNKLITVYRKVKAFNEPCFDTLVSGRSPFGFNTNHHGHTPKVKGDVEYFERTGVTFMPSSSITRNEDAVDKYKLFTAKAAEDGILPSKVIGKLTVGEPKRICSGTYLMVGPFDDENIMYNVKSYMETKFFRALVAVYKISQNAYQTVYRAVPMQDFSKSWTDDELYKKYGLTQDEIDFIESMIKPME